MPMSKGLANFIDIALLSISSASPASEAGLAETEYDRHLFRFCRAHSKYRNSNPDIKLDERYTDLSLADRLVKYFKAVLEGAGEALYMSRFETTLQQHLHNIKKGVIEIGIAGKAVVKASEDTNILNQLIIF